MIYVDTSVLLAELLAEDQHPSEAFWAGVLVSSRLAEYELWARLHAKRLARRIVFLDGGRIVEDRFAADFFASPRSAAARTYLEGESL